ncbi:type II toxin-antitoxin system death-on-curing family toxin [Fructobacillus parabroussonetiae]|uniref:Type II toxin-antitoxin system death-on-curing family toxin n=1 Tax=Fructobacillus parabroussonetiae TaxID=2713174 RepID=A0ABS5QXT2_9LACO|nr:type II toxin-antitoxin system death-on-curing family toxin [Fructobacillus parabroussonetiae]MBS9338005.1 type II toxin-antitoxin system death-on-curing family toxin [Fructobacillus parabroussonetiae]
MPIQNIAGVLLYAHDTEKQFDEFKELFIRTKLVPDVQMDELSLIKNKTQRFLKVKAKASTDACQFLLQVLPLENFSVSTMIHINEVAETIIQTESLYGLKDLAGLEQLLALSNQFTFGREYHPTVIDKASYLWYSLASKQLFHNGNKRTALLTGMLMLERNLIRMHYRDTQELYDLSLQIARKELSESELKAFIKSRSTLHLDNINFYSRFYGVSEQLKVLEEIQ